MGSCAKAALAHAAEEGRSCVNVNMPQSVKTTSAIPTSAQQSLGAGCGSGEPRPPSCRLRDAELGHDRDHDNEYMMIDATIVRAHQHSAGARKKNGPQAIGRSRGGLTTKIHALVDALGNPVALMLTPGQAHDLACAEPLIDNADPDALLADKAYDADSFIDTLTQRGITPVIPPKANRKTPRACDFALYCERNLVERFFNQLKHFRAIATRYDKLARNFLAGVQMGAAMILLN
jgi:transposase